MKIICFSFLMSLAFISSAQVDPVDKDGLAIGGYDVVAYFESNKAVKGRDDLATVFNNVRYHFSNEKNLAIFQSAPEKYLPQYEGYCALAIGTTGKKISINPEYFKVTDGKLYLFFNGRSFSG